jgi:hypothetical protein
VTQVRYRVHPRRTNIADELPASPRFDGQGRLNFFLIPNFAHSDSGRDEAQITAINDKETPCRMAAYRILPF